MQEYDLHNLQIKDKLINEYAAYEFPGNIRELQSKVFDDVARHKVNHHDTPSQNREHPKESSLNISNNHLISQDENYFNLLKDLPSLKRTTHLLIEEALKRSKGNKTLAAKLLGITRQTIIKHLSK